jgi:hypothetical protein
MTRSIRPTTDNPAESDDTFIQFHIMDGSRRIRCAISNQAMDKASSLAAPSSPALRSRSFYRFRASIHGAAMLKLKRLPPGFEGPLVLLAEDLRCLSA